MDYESLVWTLEEQKIHFHRADKFDDPLEGSVPSAVSEFSDRDFSEVADVEDGTEEKLNEFHKVLRRCTFLNCWHRNEGESMAMWELYGKSDKSLAIKSTPSKLINSLDPIKGGQTILSPVSYMDFDATYSNLDPTSLNNFNYLFGPTRITQMHDFYKIKDLSFKHEKEARLIYQAIDVIGKYDDRPKPDEDDLLFELKESDFFYDLEPKDKGFNAPIDVDELVDEIHISPEASFSDSSTVEKSLGPVLNQNEEHSLTSDDLVASTIPGDPNFEIGSHYFQKLVDSAPENANDES